MLQHCFAVKLLKHDLAFHLHQCWVDDDWWLNFHFWVNFCFKYSRTATFFTQSPLRVTLQPAFTWLWSLCLEPVTSSHWPSARSFLQSHTSASSLQGAVTFQLSPVPPPLIWHSTTETDTLCCILSKASETKKHCLLRNLLSCNFISLSVWPLNSVFTFLVFERAGFFSKGLSLPPHLQTTVLNFIVFIHKVLQMSFLVNYK